MAGAFGGASGNGVVTANGASSPMDQLVNAMMTVRMAEPLLDKVIRNFGGDVGIARNVPGAAATVTAAETVALSQVVVPEQDNGAKKPAAKKAGGPQPQ